MEQKKNTPAVRFCGFSEDWSVKKMGNLGAFSKGKGYSKSDLVETGNPIILYGHLYTNYKTIIKNVSTFSEINEFTILSKGGEVIVPSSGETAEDIVRASVVEDSNIILGGDLNIIHPKKEISSTFLALTISNGNTYQKLIKKAQGKSVVHIRNSDLEETSINLPNSKPEQTKIGSFFENLDQLLTKHQTQHQKLQALKKAMLGKLFPKKGATTPEIRFKGFTEDWEVKTLGEVGNIITGTTPPTSNSENYNGDYLWVTPTDITDEKNIKQTAKKLSEVGMSNGRFVPANSVLVTCIASIGKNAVLKEDGSCNQQINAITPNIQNNVDFLYYLIEKNSSKLMSVAGAGGMLMLNKNDFSEIEMKFTKLKEQQQIGNYFKNLDALITKHATQIEKLGAIKKACLSKMFV